MSKKISALDELTLLAAEDILPLVDFGTSITKGINVENFYQSIPVDVGIGIVPTQTFHVLSETDDIPIAPHITALFQNKGDAIGGSDYQNEVHIRLQAGTTTDHRRYINFCGFDGADDWLVGASGANRWILYDTISPGHRFQFETTDGAGHSRIQSVGAGAVCINYADGAEPSGTGGLRVYNGGPAYHVQHVLDANGYTQWNAGAATGTSINADGHLALRGVINTNYTATVKGAYTAVDATKGGVYLQSTYSPSANTAFGHVGINLLPTCGGANNMGGLIALIANPYASATGTMTDVIGAQYIVDVVGPTTLDSAQGASILIRNAGATAIDVAHGVYVGSTTNSGGGSITVNYGMRILDQTVGGTNIGIRSGVTSGANKYNLYLDGTAVNYIVGRTGFNILAPLAQVHIDQSDNAAAIPTMILDQADESEGFINFIGSDRGVITGVTNSTASVRVEIGGVVHRLALYADA